MSEITQLLKHLSLFRGLNEDQLSRVAQITHSKSYGAHTHIFDQGDEGDNMYIINTGQVEIRVQDRVGGTTSVLILGQGQVFGEMALIDHGERSASVVALQPNTTLYAIDKDSFQDLCQSDTAIGYMMMRNIAQDLSLKIRHQNSFS